MEKMNSMNLLHGDCLQKMHEIENQSIDMVFADMPYGTTKCKWDTIIDLGEVWSHLNRICKPNSAIVMTAVQPFTTILINSNIKNFRHNWVWQKSVAGNFLNTKKHPLKIKKMSDKNPEFLGKIKNIEIKSNGMRYPVSIQKFSNCNNKNIHPTQKPLPLIEYLVRTYSKENSTVLDFCMGGRTTGVACKKLNRNFIGIEKDDTYFDAAKNRIEAA